MAINALKSVNRNSVYALVIVISIAFMYLVRPANVVTPHGIFLPNSSTTYPAIAASQVQLYQKPVANSSSIGSVRVELHVTKDTRSNEKDVVEYARKLAAQAGANGLVINTFRMLGPAGLEQRYVLIGNAVIIK